MKYNPKIHNRRSIRLKGYDYSQSGLYFITICCFDKICHFGKIEYGEMQLNEAGSIACECWSAIPQHFPNVVLHEYVVMPNHVHGILQITHPVGANQNSPNQYSPNQYSPNQYSPNQHSPDPRLPNQYSPNPCLPNTIDHKTKDMKSVGTNLRNSPNTLGGPNDSSPRSPSNTIGSMVRGFKIGVTKWMRQNKDIYDVWQRNYYEHIIRNDQSHQTIADYIVNNPVNWENDGFYVI